jgi:hypothetical protein
MNKSAHTIVRRICIVAFIAVVAIGHATSTFATELATVQTKSGRTFQGVVDAKSDDAKLWLRFGTTQAQILRPIAWSQVVTATYAGREYDAAAFRQIVSKIKSAAPQMPPRIKSHKDTGLSDAQRAQMALADVAPRIESLEITAYPANWDRDVEVDGLVVTITARNEFGEMVPTSGTLEVDLVTEMSRVRETITAGESRIRNERIGRWTRSVEPDHFGPLGASYRLPFQAVHPEFKRNLIDLSLVNARLAVPGAGTFNASTTAVRIQPLSTVRDRYENRHGSRFMPIERTGHGKLE